MPEIYGRDTDKGGNTGVHEIPAIWSLNGDMLYVDASASYSKFFNDTYQKKTDASCWVRQEDGSYIYLDENGNILKNHMTPDGFYVGPDGNGRHSWECA